MLAPLLTTISVSEGHDPLGHISSVPPQTWPFPRSIHQFTALNIGESTLRAGAGACDSILDTAAETSQKELLSLFFLSVFQSELIPWEFETELMSRN